MLPKIDSDWVFLSKLGSVISHCSPPRGALVRLSNLGGEQEKEDETEGILEAYKIEQVKEYYPLKRDV